MEVRVIGGLKVGDIVSRNSYNNDIIFKIIDIKETGNETLYILKGTNFRIIADSLLDDLKVSSEEEYNKQNEEINKRLSVIDKDKRGLFRGEETRGKKKNKKRGFGVSPRILHLDGDEEYLDVCLNVYTSLGIEAYGKVVPEIEQSRLVTEYLNLFRPDILILTGHDSVTKDCRDFKNINNYRNSKYFVEAVKRAREYESSYDELIIFAGACQSYYEEIIKAGAH